MVDKIKKLWPDWEVQGEIGSGGCGFVYEIRKDDFGFVEKAALKVISIPKNRGEINELYSSGYDNASISTWFKSYLDDIAREYKLMDELKGHTNIVYCDEIKHIQHEDGIGWDIFIKMELLTPFNSKPATVDFSENEVIQLGKDICTALVLCGKRSIVHRDIKPSNILLSKDGDYKLGDFGVAKTMDHATMASKVGTYDYMAPEVYKGEKYDAGADIYSLGLVMYWMLNKRIGPFLPLPPSAPTHSDKDLALIRRFMGEEIPAPIGGSPKLQAIVLKACAFDPANRYSSAQEMLADLNSLNLKDTPETEGPTVPVNHTKPDEDGNEAKMVPEPEPRPGPKPKHEPKPNHKPKHKPKPKPKPPAGPKRGRIFLALALLVVIGGGIAAAVFTGVFDFPDNNTGNDNENEIVNPEPEDNAGDSADDFTPDEPANDTTPEEDPPVQELVWSEWASTLPNFVYDGSYIVESKLQYRSAPRYDFFGPDALTDDYTVCYTGYTDWGEVGKWQSAYIEEDELTRVETRTRYRYRYLISYKYRENWVTKTGYYPGPWYYSDTPVTKTSDMDKVESFVEYRCQTRMKIYFCARNNEWSDYGDTIICPAQDTVVNTRVMYRYAKANGETAAPSMENFPATAPIYSSRFVDVPDSSWYGAEQGNWIGTVVDLGVMSANEYQQFRPDETITVGELIKAAVAVRKLYNGDCTVMKSSTPWYGSYVDYAIEMDIIERGVFSDYNKPATRADAAYILGRVLPAEEYTKRNTVRAITDVSMESKSFDSVWRLAESGVISWPDPEGAFNPDGGTTRAEIAAMISRLVYPEMRA